MENKKYTLSDLKSVGFSQCFANGIAELPEQREVRWVAKKGDVEDWAIYYGPMDWEQTRIMERGHKLYDPSTIKSLLPCDRKMLKAYRK